MQPEGGVDANTSSSFSKYKTSLDKMREDSDTDEGAGFWQSIGQFDISFLVVISVCNFAQGFRRLLELGLYYVFKEKLGLQPGEITLLLGIMAFPWIAKIFLAIFSDNISIFGSRRKSYLIINSSVVILSIVLLMALGVKEGKVFIMTCVFISQVCMTWNDAITDALIAQASRSDLKKGAANLQTVASMAYAIGGIIACCSAGSIELSSSEGEQIDPNWYFGTYAVLISILLVASICLNRALEPEIIEVQRSREERQQMRGRVPGDGIMMDMSVSSVDSFV